MTTAEAEQAQQLRAGLVRGRAALVTGGTRGIGAVSWLRAQIPVGRLGTPEEIARVVCFLAADASSYITGQIWAVNGGLDM